jgi:hypothetical protein
MTRWTFGFGALLLSASGALFLTQCGDSNLGTGGELGGDAAASCPTNPPTNGSACSLPSGTTCNNYPEPGCECCGASVYICQNGTWQQEATATPVSNIAPACPVTLPEAGTTCQLYTGGCGGEVPAQVCRFPCADGTSNALAECTGTWQINAVCADDDAGTDAGDGGDGG